MDSINHSTGKLLQSASMHLHSLPHPVASAQKSRHKACWGIRGQKQLDLRKNGDAQKCFVEALHGTISAIHAGEGFGSVPDPALQSESGLEEYLILALISWTLFFRM